MVLVCTELHIVPRGNTQQCSNVPHIAALSLVTSTLDDASVMHPPHALGALAELAHTSGRSVRLQRGQCPLTGRVLAILRLRRTGLSFKGYLRGRRRTVRSYSCT